MFQTGHWIFWFWNTDGFYDLSKGQYKAISKFVENCFYFCGHAEQQHFIQPLPLWIQVVIVIELCCQKQYSLSGLLIMIQSLYRFKMSYCCWLNCRAVKLASVHVTTYSSTSRYVPTLMNVPKGWILWCSWIPSHSNLQKIWNLKWGPLDKSEH